MNNSVIIVSLLILFSCASNTFAASTNTSKSSADKTETKLMRSEAEEDVRLVLYELSKAVNDADADKVVSFWMDNGTFIDESGEITKGKAALKDRFSKSLHRQENALMQMHPDEMKFPASNVAVVRGDVSRKSGTVDLPASRFMMVLVKNADRWQISEASETKISDLKAADHLQEIEWLIGKWHVDSANHPTVMTVEWSPSRNFIISKISQEKNGVQEVDTQLIGWDPRSSSIISWHFGNDGSFGFGHWHHEMDRRWVVSFSGVATDGSATKAKNVFVLKNGIEIAWQSVEQTSGSNSIPDTDQIKLLKDK